MKSPRRQGHAHFSHNAFSRRQFLRAAGLASGAAVTSGLWMPILANAAAFNEADPRPIPGGTKLPFQSTPFHFFFPTDGVPGAVTVESGHGDPSLITDFDGFVGVAEVGKTAGTATLTGEQLLWKADVRFMTGSYLGTERDARTGAFAFV
jgi:hypothetical protein